MITEFKPKVSIIIPVYNGANYMRDAIDSALGQTYPNIEVIVVNDGSNDNGETDKIAKSYGDKIRYFEKPNGGVASALNYGIERATGEYISWLSHDDIYFYNKIELQIELLGSMDNKNTIIYSDYDIIDQNKEYKYTCSMIDNHEIRKLNNLYYSVVYGLLNGCTMLIPKVVLVSNNCFNISLKYTQDYDCWYRMARNNCSVRYLNKTVLQSRQHEKQDSKNPNSIEECNQLWIRIFDDVLEHNYLYLENKILLINNIIENFKFLGYSRLVQYLSDYRIKENTKLKDKYGDSPLVSVIITCYNQAKYIQEAVEMTLCNGYSNIEVIIVDDGSNDTTTLNILKSYKNNSKVNVLYIENSGVSNARNVGLSKAKGLFIQFLDGDDYLCKNKIHKQVSYLIEHPETDIVYSNYLYLYEATGRFSIIDNSTLIMDNHKQFESLLYTWQVPLSIPIHSFLFKKECFENLKFDTSYKICEDYMMWLEICHENKNMAFLDFHGCVYRIHDSSATKSNGFKILLDAVKVITEINNKYNHEIELDKFKMAKRQYLDLILNNYFFYVPIANGKNEFVLRESNNLNYSSSLILKTYHSYRKFGLKATVKKILVYLKGRF